jgi:hypothetical protein
MLTSPGAIDPRRLALRLVGDASETCFWDRASLEAVLTRAVERPAWRAGVAAGIAARASESCTLGVFVREVMAWAAGRLSGSGPTGASVAA